MSWASFLQSWNVQKNVQTNKQTNKQTIFQNYPGSLAKEWPSSRRFLGNSSRHNQKKSARKKKRKKTCRWPLSISRVMHNWRRTDIFGCQKELQKPLRVERQVLWNRPLDNSKNCESAWQWYVVAQDPKLLAVQTMKDMAKSLKTRGLKKNLIKSFSFLACWKSFAFPTPDLEKSENMPRADVLIHHFHLLLRARACRESV